MKPEEALKKLNLYKKNLDKALSLSVAVGLPTEKASSKVYDSGLTVMEVGYKHEYGIGVPMRSWLREPIQLNQKKILKFTQIQFQKVIQDGMDSEKALARVGLYAEKFIGEAFETGGYGQWEALEESTKVAKGSSAILVDKGTLKQSISSAVRDD